VQKSGVDARLRPSTGTRGKGNFNFRHFDMPKMSIDSMSLRWKDLLDATILSTTIITWTTWQGVGTKLAALDPWRFATSLLLQVRFHFTLQGLLRMERSQIALSHA